MSEATRKAAYRYVAALLGRVAHPPELELELERIRRANELAGAEPPAAAAAGDEPVTNGVAAGK